MVMMLVMVDMQIGDHGDGVDHGADGECGGDSVLYDGVNCHVEHRTHILLLKKQLPSFFYQMLFPDLPEIQLLHRFQ